jgi:hypothetical protein
LRPVSEKAKVPVSTLTERSKPSSFDYWAFVFGAFMVAAILLVAWRLGGIFLGASAAPSSATPHTTSRTSTPAISAVAPITSTGRAGPEQAVRPKHDEIAKTSSPNQARPQSEQKEASVQPVIVRAIVGVDGTVKQAKVIRGNSALAEAALATVRRLNFTPYAPNGTAVEFETEVAVSRPRGTQGSQESIQISVPQPTETIQSNHP